MKQQHQQFTFFNALLFPTFIFYFHLFTLLFCIPVFSQLLFQFSPYSITLTQAFLVPCLTLPHLASPCLTLPHLPHLDLGRRQNILYISTLVLQSIPRLCSRGQCLGKGHTGNTQETHRGHTGDTQGTHRGHTGDTWSMYNIIPPHIIQIKKIEIGRQNTVLPFYIILYIIFLSWFVKIFYSTSINTFHIVFFFYFYE